MTVEQAELRTERLVLRRWRGEDLAPFRALNADPEVMEYFPATLTAEQSDAMARRADAAFDELGFGLYAVEVPGELAFAGYVGLAPVPDELPFAPAVEIGWRLARVAWGHGHATEAARACVSFAFSEDGPALAELVSMTAVANARSRRVMERIGMHRDPADDFDHTRIDPSSPLRRHVLYRLRRDGTAGVTGRPA